MKKDILNKKDIEKLVILFVEKIKKEKEINLFFTEVAHVDWEKHQQVMCRFWENVLFYTGSYNGNPMQKHLDINSKHNISANHFTQWISLFNKSIDELFVGENAEILKQRAQNISTVMQVKILK